MARTAKGSFNDRGAHVNPAQTVTLTVTLVATLLLPSALTKVTKWRKWKTPRFHPPTVTPNPRGTVNLVNRPA